MTAILSLITEPGDVVLCEAITYPGIRNVAGRLGIRLVGVEMDADGVTPDALDAAIRAHAPKALYLNPTLQNPTTLTIPPERREALASIVLSHELTVIEDDAYGFIPAKAPPPIALSAPELTWHIGGLAKCIGAGLRLAFTIAPTSRCAVHLAQAIRTFSVMPSPLSMALTTQWIEDGTADSIRRFIRSESKARQEIAAEVLQGFTFRSAPNAFNLWLDLPENVSRAEVLARMARRRIGLMPADAFSISAPAGRTDAGRVGRLHRARRTQGIFAFLVTGNDAEHLHGVMCQHWRSLFRRDFTPRGPAGGEWSRRAPDSLPPCV